MASSCDLEREDGRGCLLYSIGFSDGAVPGKLGLGKLLRESRCLRLRRHREPYCSTARIATSAFVGGARLMGEEMACCGMREDGDLNFPGFLHKKQRGLLDRTDIRGCLCMRYSSRCHQSKRDKCHATKSSHMLNHALLLLDLKNQVQSLMR